jgi:hypothetical protein
MNRIVFTMNDNMTTVARVDFYSVVFWVFLTTLGKLNVSRHRLPRAELWLIEILLSSFENLADINRMGSRYLRD